MDTQTPPAEPAPKRKVFLALPTYASTMRRDFVLSLLNILWMDPIPGMEFTIGTFVGDGVARSRNNLAQQFLLATDCTDFLCIDVDIVFTRENVIRLLDGLTDERPILGGLYAAKQVTHRWIKTDLDNEETDAQGYKKVYEIGTGFKGMRRRPFELMMEAFPEIQYFCDGSQERLVKWDFFSMGVVNSRYLSEDYYFDYRARCLGIPIHADTRCELQHEGSIRYPFASNLSLSKRVNLATLFRIAESLGDTGFAATDDVLQIATRVINENAA